MGPIDPAQLLAALGPLLSEHGGIKGIQEAIKIASIMKSATKLVSRCIYLNILRVTDSHTALEKFLEVGGWDTLNLWLDGSRGDAQHPLLGELLEVYRSMPVTVTLLKQNSAAKTIKSLSKADNDKIKSLSSQLVDTWTKTIRKGQDKEDADKKDKAKKKETKNDKDKENEKKDKDKKESEKHRKSDTKDSISHSQRDSKDPKDSNSHRSSKDHRDRNSRDKDRSSKDKSKSSSDSKSSSRSSSSTNHTTPSSRSKDSSSSSSASKKYELDPSSRDDETRMRPKTVKRVKSSFRSTGLFDTEESEEDEAKKKVDKLTVKRPGVDLKGEDLEKKPRLTLAMPTLISANAPIPELPQTPEVMHGLIKIIPAKPRAPGHQIEESNAFMASLQKSKVTVKRKKKVIASPTTPSISGPTSLSGAPSLSRGASQAMSPPSGSSPPQGPPTDSERTSPPPLLSPTTAMIHKLPSIPSFYRDTLEDEPESSEKKADASEDQKDTAPSILSASAPPLPPTETPPPLPPPMEGLDPDSGVGSSEASSGESKDSSCDGSIPGSSESGAPGSGVALVSEEIVDPPKRKSNKPKKSVTWPLAEHLEAYFYFELDENERENVNRPKTFIEMKRDEMMFDRRCMETARRVTNDCMVEVLPWRRPKVIEDVIVVAESGYNSKERQVQEDRERAVLCALFFNKLPDFPIEPEPDMLGEDQEMRIIPLEDDTGSCTEYEHAYNFEDPSSLPYDPEFGGVPVQGQVVMNPGVHMGMGNNNGVPGVPMPGMPDAGGFTQGGTGPWDASLASMPPALAQLLATLRQQAQETRDPMMSTLQGRLTMVMQNTNPQDSGMLMNRILEALEPFKNQIPGLSNLISSLTSGVDPMAGGRGMMGPSRHGLLGSGPPGFLGAPPGGMRGPHMPQGGQAFYERGPPPPPPPPMEEMRGEMRGDRGEMRGERGDMRGDMRGDRGEMRRDMRGGGPQWRGRGGRPYSRRGHKREVCTFYMKKGSCKFGDGCSFIHPGPDS